ncbi:MAG: DUF4262 domain-containing protein [Eubacteriales bacterium]|nr:DUF4262 domain-containing protein [Eubacteriales bacterium]
MKPKIDWVIHLVMNGVKCACCDEVENGFLPYLCNCHTHGMGKYNHPDFQLVLNYPNEEIGRILNTFGLRVQAGEQFKDGDMVEGIYEDCPVRLSEFWECGRKVLRVIVPDKQNRFPEDENCTAPHVFQMLDTRYLMKGAWRNESKTVPDCT